MNRASSLEQEILWCVLDQDAIASIIESGRSLWKVDADTIWAEIRKQAALGRLRAYWRDGTDGDADLTRISLKEAEAAYELWVEPTQETFRRLAEIKNG